MRQGGPSTSEAFVSANGLSLCYQAFGHPAHPPLVLIMGIGAQMVGWDEEFCQALAAHGFLVIRFDNRDAGKSTRFDHVGMPDVASAMTRAWMRMPVSAPYLLGDMARDVVGLLDALDIPKAHFVGASMGGGIAQILATSSPQRVLSLTSIMSTTGNPALPPPRPEAMVAMFKQPPDALPAYIEYYVQTWKVLRAGGFPEEELRDRARAARNHARGLNPAGAARQLMAILASGSRLRDLCNVAAPTMVIHGDSDPLVPLAAGLETAQQIPGAQLLVLKGMGHALPMRLWPQVIEGILRVAG